MRQFNFETVVVHQATKKLLKTKQSFNLEMSEFLDLVMGMELTIIGWTCERKRETTKQNVGRDVSISMYTHPVN